MSNRGPGTERGKTVMKDNPVNMKNILGIPLRQPGWMIPAKRIKQSGLIVIILLQIGMHSQIIYSQDMCWSIFRGNQALNGVTKVEVPSQISQLWSFPTEGEIKSSPVVCGDKIVIASTDGNIYCLDNAGSLIWKFNTGNAIEAGALILDGMVYIGNLDGSFFAIDIESGEKHWEYKTENQISGSANWIEIKGKKYLFVGSYDYYLHCIDAATGEGIWKYESDNFINGAAALYKGNAVFGGCDGFLHIVNLEKGELNAKIELATYIAGSSAISGDRAYIGDYDGMVRCVDLAKKEVAWKWSEENTYLPFIASPAVSGNYVVTGNENKYIYCFKEDTGEQLWKVNTRARVHASPVISGNKVLTANLRGDLFLLDLKTGNVLLEYELGSPVTSNPAIYRGRIYLGAQDGVVYCLGKK